MSAAAVQRTKRPQQAGRSRALVCTRGCVAAGRRLRVWRQVARAQRGHAQWRKRAITYESTLNSRTVTLDDVPRHLERRAHGAELQSDLDHINGLDDRGRHHARQTAVDKGLDFLPYRWRCTRVAHGCLRQAVCAVAGEWSHASLSKLARAYDSGHKHDAPTQIHNQLLRIVIGFCTRARCSQGGELAPVLPTRGPLAHGRRRAGRRGCVFCAPPTLHARVFLLSAHPLRCSSCRSTRCL